MRARLFIFILLVATQNLVAADARASGSVRGRLVVMFGDATVKEADEHSGIFLIGFPAFQGLNIRHGETPDQWIVSGTICSTNTGFVTERAGIYVGYEKGQYKLAAISNLKGEVLFSVSPLVTTDSPPELATHLYIGLNPSTDPLLTGQTLREYVLRTTIGD